MTEAPPGRVTPFRALAQALATFERIQAVVPPPAANENRRAAQAAAGD
jgi:hypothetical protein